MVARLIILGLLSLCVPLETLAAEETERRTAKFLDAVDAGLGKLDERLPQLPYWGQLRAGYGTPAKVWGGWRIDYNSLSKGFYRLGRKDRWVGKIA